MKHYLIFDDVSHSEGDPYRVTDNGIVQFEVNGEWYESLWDSIEDLSANLIGEGFRVEEVDAP